MIDSNDATPGSTKNILLFRLIKTWLAELRKKPDPAILGTTFETGKLIRKKRMRYSLNQEANTKHH